MRLRNMIIGLTVLAGVLAIIPWIDGFLFKRNYYHWIRVLAADKTVDIQILDYHQGWFQSSAKLSVISLDTNIILNQTISHGPLVRDADGRHWTLALAAIQDEMNTPSGVIKSRTIMALDGNCRMQFETPPVKIEIPQRTTIVWQGLRGNVHFYMNAYHLQKVTIDMLIGAATFNEKTELNPSHIQISFENISSAGALKLARTVKRLGHSIYSLTPSQSRELELVIPELITTTTLIQQQGELNTSYGNAFFGGQITWPYTVKTMKGVIRGAKGVANIRMASALVNQLMDSDLLLPADQMHEELNRLIAQGIILQDKTDYMISLALEKGIVKANGREVQRLM